MARRRRHEEEHENLERWLVSYADFITLLFAFFVVMYAVSSVNEGKYRVLSETLNSVFSVEARSDKPIQIGERPRDPLAQKEGPLAPRQAEPVAGGRDGSEEIDKGAPADQAADIRERFQVDGGARRAADELTISLQEYLDQGLVRITRVGDRIEVEMKDRMLFGSGNAQLSHQVLPVLREMAQTLGRIPSRLLVEGHTDNVPISTAAFPSNWELSAARAASVVHFLARAGVDPQRMSAVGLGEYRPLAENTTVEGRAANRRVTVVVLADQRTDEPAPDAEIPWAEGPGVETR
ncbi:MAG: flagellar motor protein MotD [Chromatiaceae bacterium]|nr:flagellar motor protein MotD [Chromatiaceae bacterium]MCP5312542.1 flagellar motor protein MotD [Chromatiaceae bacterium]